MSFFKDFKEDLSQAVNELMPGGDDTDTLDNDSDVVVNTLEDELDVQSELSKLDGLLEKVSRDAKMPVTQQKAPERKAEAPAAEPVSEVHTEKAEAEPAPAVPSAIEAHKAVRAKAVQSEEPAPAAEAPAVKDEPSAVEQAVPSAPEQDDQELDMQEDKKMSEAFDEVLGTEDMAVKAPVTPAAPVAPSMPAEVSDEVSVITEGTSISGNLSSAGSLDIRGSIQGDVQCNGKLVVTGTINGNSNSAEFFADAAKVEGEVVSSGTVKIGLGSVIIGNITASSAVIAGAIKGDIDVQGPVVVDTSAVVMGNIKSRSVQINNGAVIEGFCSQCYADIDVDSLFGEK